MTIDRVPTPFDGKIYTPDWHAWRDPDIPDWIDPVEVLLTRHLGTPVENKPAIVGDGVVTTYGELSKLVDRFAGALAGLGVAPESRLLLFGTDSLDYVAVWLATVRVGAIPVVVSDLYKSRDLLYFITDRKSHV